MGHAIPKIQFGTKSFVGDTTSGNDTLTNIADTTGAEIGMYISGPGIPANTTILSKTSLTIQMSAQATATATAQAIETFYKIEFDYPPVEPKSEKLSPQERKSVSLTGLTQVSVDYIEGIRNLDFRFLTNALFLELKNFYENYAVYGDEFRLYDDKTLVDYKTYELRNFDFEADKIAPKGTSYVWAVKMQLRRAV